MKILIKNILIFVAIIWGIYLVDFLIPFFDLNQFGIVPRTLSGLVGILFAPLLHGNILHLVSNTVSLIVLLFILFKFYKEQAMVVIILSVLIGGSLVWLMGRSASHIGASGLIYSLAAFNITFGFLQKKILNIIVSLVVVFLYGGLIWGVLPTRFYVSWESHLFGAIAGISLASMFNKRKKTTDEEL